MSGDLRNEWRFKRGLNWLSFLFLLSVIVFWAAFAVFFLGFSGCVVLSVYQKDKNELDVGGVQIPVPIPPRRRPTQRHHRTQIKGPCF
jgi:hypothetical protein